MTLCVLFLAAGRIDRVSVMPYGRAVLLVNPCFVFNGNLDAVSGWTSALTSCILLRMVVRGKVGFPVVAEGGELVLEHVVVDCRG